MILDAQCWINDLQKNVLFFDEKLGQRVWRRASFVAFEKRFVLSCFIIRKLAEANAIDKDVFESPVRVLSYKNRGKKVTQENMLEIEQLYETGRAETITKPLSYIVNQVIHSYTFAYCFESLGVLKGVIFNSDRSKSKELYLLELSDFIKVLSPIAGCSTGRTVMEYDDRGYLVAVNKN